jgi:hypothetical protein
MALDGVIDLTALHHTADGNATLTRDLVLHYLGTADACLQQLQALVVHGSASGWKPVVFELQAASRRIHATQLAALCLDAAESTADTSARMRAYLRLKDAYEALLAYLRAANILSPIRASKRHP